MTFDDITAPEPFEPQDSWAGGADLGRGARHEPRGVYRAGPTRPHPADCGCSIHGKPPTLSRWANWRRG